MNRPILHFHDQTADLAINPLITFTKYLFHIIAAQEPQHEIDGNDQNRANGKTNQSLGNIVADDLVVNQHGIDWRQNAKQIQQQAAANDFQSPPLVTGEDFLAIVLQKMLE